MRIREHEACDRGEDALEIAWGRLVESALARPFILERLERRLATVLEDPGELAGLPDDEAELVARLAHLGLGELLVRLVRRGCR
jgi:hypothetical protein